MTGTDPACKWSAVVLSPAWQRAGGRRRSGAIWWRCPEALRQTLAAADGFDAAADALRGATRVIATGNGAAYYVAQAPVAGVPRRGRRPRRGGPAGRAGGGRPIGWRDGDRLLAVSSSGEFRDVIDAVEQGAPRPVACVTAKPSSSVGKLADGRAVQTVLHQRALTHTQAFCGGVATALAVWARVTGDAGLTAALAGVATAVEQAIAATERFMDALGPLPVPSAAVVFGSARRGRRARGRAVPEGGRDGADRGVRDARGRHDGDVRARRGPAGAQPRDQGRPAARGGGAHLRLARSHGGAAARAATSPTAGWRRSPRCPRSRPWLPRWR